MAAVSAYTCWFPAEVFPDCLDSSANRHWDHSNDSGQPISGADDLVSCSALLLTRPECTTHRTPVYLCCSILLPGVGKCLAVVGVWVAAARRRAYRPKNEGSINESNY